MKNKNLESKIFFKDKIYFFEWGGRLVGGRGLGHGW